MNAYRTAVGERPQRRRYLLLGAFLGLGTLALGLALLDPFVGAAGAWTVVASVGLFVLAVAAGYDGAGVPVTAAFVALVAAGLAPFLTVGLAPTVQPASAVVAQAAFVAAVALVAGVVLGVPGFLVGAAVRWWAASRARRGPPATAGSGRASADDPEEEPTDGSRG